jgi:hypothetical protein
MELAEEPNRTESKLTIGNANALRDLLDTETHAYAAVRSIGKQKGIFENSMTR